MSTWTDDDLGLVSFAEQAKSDVQRTGGAQLLAGVVASLALRVVELTVEIRRLKSHDARAVDSWEDGELNALGTFRGVCSCGWSTAWDEQAIAVAWVAKHRGFYAETTT